jgi:hypothetical protein
MATEDLFPGNTLNIVLLDQSASMSPGMEGFGLSMAEATTSAVNLFLQKTAQVRSTMPELFISDSFGVVVFGYGSEVNSREPIIRIDSKDVRADKDRTKRDESTISSNMGLPNFPTWVLPAAAGDGRMRVALASAGDVLEKWIPEHGSAPPPQVVNITSGDTGDGDLLEESDRIKGLSTSNGGVVLWTCHVAAGSAEPLLFPRDIDAASRPENLRLLLKSSSIIPQTAVRNLLMEFPEVSRIAGARTCVLNANLATLVRVLSCASRLPLP